MAQSLKIRKTQFLLNLLWLLCMKESLQYWELSPWCVQELLMLRTLVCSPAEQLSELAHLLLSEQVIAGHAVFRCHMGESVLLKATSLCFKNLLSRMFFAS